MTTPIRPIPPSPQPTGSSRERATTAREFDPEEIARGAHATALPPFVLAALPLVTVVSVNLLCPFGFSRRSTPPSSTRSTGARRRSQRSAASGP